jgi:hypothetical protein
MKIFSESIIYTYKMQHIKIYRKINSESGFEFVYDCAKSYEMYIIFIENKQIHIIYDSIKFFKYVKSNKFIYAFQ